MFVQLSFKQKMVTIIFDHQYMPPGEEKLIKAKSIMHITEGEELPFFFTVLQARNPEVVAQLVFTLKTKLESEVFADFERSALEYAIKSLSELAGTHVVWAEVDSKDDEEE